MPRGILTRTPATADAVSLPQLLQALGLAAMFGAESREDEAASEREVESEGTNALGDEDDDRELCRAVGAGAEPRRRMFSG
ncbi:hypothetical protein GSI_08823 [Ganoderma sinense ZZ0214-1]|uniref:Uncharacterized protein n=1 Tax=Ganoderma sinense ZZ0214-1 TaxID=1077348 RepID=A0A2G8S4R3_9APHY|nr:hypothetical protein GSI_08823 [Ganoderma sinense ZZ0214-1]